MGIIATRSLDEPVMGLRDLMAQNEDRIRDGIQAYGMLEELRAGNDSLKTSLNSMR